MWLIVHSLDHTLLPTHKIDGIILFLTNLPVDQNDYVLFRDRKENRTLL